MAYGPQWGQTDKYGKAKCSYPTRSNGGIKRTKKANTKKEDIKKES